MPTVDLNRYKGFVKEVTSDASNDTTEFIDRIIALSRDHEDVNISLLLTAAIGMPAEVGEFSEIPKKIVFQGKPMDDDAKYHMLRELGDVFFYWITACRALNVDPNYVINTNVEKLEARYPGGKFNVTYSENRKEGDI